MVIYFTERNQRKGSSEAQRKGTLLELVNRKFTRVFNAVTDDKGDGPAVVKAFSLCPQIGQPYVAYNDSDSLATCTQVDVEPTASPFAWVVTATYDTDRLVSLTLDNPLNLPAEINWTFAKYERPFTRDQQGLAVVNSSKEYFDPPLMVEESRPVLTIVRNEATFNAANALLFQDTVNSVTFAGAAPYYCKLNNITGKRQIDIGLVYYQVTYEFEFRREGFFYFILDKGWRDIDGKLFRDPLVPSQTMSNETLLNGRGTPRFKVKAVLLEDMNHTQTTLVPDIEDSTAYATLGFPPPPEGGTANWYFQVKIGDEIMTVIDVSNPSSWVVLRGQSGSSPVNHFGDDVITLEPYYLRYIPFRVADYNILNLPVV